MNVTQLSRSARETDVTFEESVVPATTLEIGNDQIRIEGKWNGDLFGGGWEAEFNRTVWKSDPDGTVSNALSETERRKGDGHE